MGTEVPKQYLALAGRTVIEHTLARLCAHPALAGVVVAVSPDDVHWPRLRLHLPVPLHTVAGGAERAHSVCAGLDHLETCADPGDWVLVHDAARPCLRRADLEQLVDTLVDHPVGGLLALPVSDTVKRTDAAGEVLETVPRTGLWRALTPQMFHLRSLREALAVALARGQVPTDESAAMEAAGHRPRVVAGHSDNIKITHPQDLARAELFLRKQESKTSTTDSVSSLLAGRDCGPMRIGHGFDAHRFAPGRRLVLGGVTIPFDRGLAAHSDGDVVIHALCDALLGAAGLGDIGRHFPDTAAEFENIDSRLLLRRVMARLAEGGWAVGNADITVVAQVPRLSPFIEAMRVHLAQDLGVAVSRVNVKATTTERMGYTGRAEGIAAHAVVLLTEGEINPP
jgi:2-C-methyl-D-erythritol 4-phosphate cytidylyltransferase/2-C-methyl-D-erythritol 2,4-cyclodiphosphate synthase